MDIEFMKGEKKRIIEIEKYKEKWQKYEFWVGWWWPNHAAAMPLVVREGGRG